MSDPSNLTVEKISGLFKDRVAELQERARRRIMVHRIHGAEWLLLVVMGRTGQQAIRALRLRPRAHRLKSTRKKLLPFIVVHGFKYDYCT